MKNNNKTLMKLKILYNFQKGEIKNKIASNNLASLINRSANQKKSIVNKLKAAGLKTFLENFLKFFKRNLEMS
jgi:hypothetical protein